MVSRGPALFPPPAALSGHLRFEAGPVTYRGRLATYSKSCGWVLCVGAGISNTIFPCWNELAANLLTLTQQTYPTDQVTAFIQSFGPEALMQAVANLLSREESEDIPQHLSATLYNNIRTKAGDKWITIAKALTSSKPSNLTRHEWTEFERFVSSFTKSSAPFIAKAVAEVADTDRRPEAIISFNAEPLLYSLINCYYALLHPNVIKQSNVKILDRLSHDLASRTKGRIPYYYVHGILPVPDGQPQFNNSIALDKLVFTESQYLQLSRSAYSWQSATFLGACIHHRCVFVGVSFSDPNLRRWLAWEHDGRTLQRRNKRLPTKRASHFWLKKRPNPRGKDLSPRQILIEKSVEHLGVGVVWIDDWDEVGDRLRLMLETDE